MFDEELEATPGTEGRGGGSGPTTRNQRLVQPAASCPALNKAGNPCRMRPTASGRCIAHSDAEAHRARAGRGGTLKAAHAALAAQRTAMIERYGLQADLPTLDSVEALGVYLAGVAARVEVGQLTPAQANSLVGVAKLSKDLLGLSLDIRLAEKLDAQEGR